MYDYVIIQGRVKMFIDSHAHLTDEPLRNYSPNKCLDAVIISAYNAKNIEKTLELCKTNAKYFPTVGIHPQFCDDYDNTIKNIILNAKSQLVGIGEIGLDKTYECDYEKQKEIFIKQIELAKNLKLPLIIHARNNYSDIFEIIKSFNYPKFMVHAFNGSKEDCFRALNLGAYISFACNITYKRHVGLRKLSALIPQDRLLIETDSPNALPATFMRNGFNTPNNIYYVAETIAQERKSTLEEIGNLTKENAIKFFNLNLTEVTK